MPCHFGWAIFGTNQVTQVLQNNLTLGNASIDILGPDWDVSDILQGQYTAVLQPGQNPFTESGLINSSLTQTGLVPTNAESLVLEAQGTNFTVSFAGQNIPLLPIGSRSNYTLFGGDISSFAGDVGELRLSTLSPLGASVLLDAISFSTQVVPEPSSLSLLTGGVLGLFFWRRARRKAA